MTRVALLTLAALALAGCGNQTASPGAGGYEPGDPAASPTAVPAAEGPVETTYAVTVLDDGNGAELCVGGVAESLPPQCGGPSITNWDWSEHDGDFEDVGGTRWGDFHVAGTFDGERFTASEVTSAEEFEAPPLPDEDGLGTPCPDPGGWSGADPVRMSRQALDEAVAVARRLDGYGSSWLDRSRDLRTLEELDLAASAGKEDVSSWILNVSVTRDLDGAESAMRRLWGGALCVSRAPHTWSELRRVQREVGDLPGLTGAGAGPEHVEVGVIYDDGSLQAWLDAEYGAGLVRVFSALVGI